MIFEISIAIAVLIFAILVFFIVKTLLILQRTLKRVDVLLFDIELKSKHLDSLTRSLSNIGEICENETDRLKEAYAERTTRQRCEAVYATSDWAEWLVLSLNLGAKLLKKR